MLATANLPVLLGSFGKTMILGWHLLVYFLVGFVEMFLATQRTYWIAQGRSLGAALLVFVENFVAVYIIYQIANGTAGHWPVLIAYACGNAFGTFINLEKVPF